MSKTIRIAVPAVVSEDGLKCSESCHSNARVSSGIRRCDQFYNGGIPFTVLHDGLRCPECLAAEEALKKGEIK